MKETFNVYGMSCSMCAKKIEDKLSSFDGVSAKVLLNDGKVIIDYDESKYDLLEFKSAIKKLGYKLDVPNKKLENAKLIICVIITLYFLVLEGGMIFYHLPMFMENGYLQLALSSIVIIIFGIKTFKRALMDFKARSLGMDVLVSSGVICAYLLSIYQLFAKGSLYFASAAMILTIVAIGKRIEERVKHNTAYTVSLLQKKMNSVAHLVSFSENEVKIKDVEAKMVEVGSIIKVLNGEAIPLDGIVKSGEASIDTSILTGESKLLAVKENDVVSAGTIVKEGVIEVITTSTLSSTTLAKIIEKVEEASAFKPPIERITRKIANYFVPIVFIFAFISFIITLLVSKSFETSIIRFATVVLVSCPCALGLATPMAILVGSNKAASNGIIFKAGEYLESARKIDLVCFDKTKTITTGQMKVLSSSVGEDYIDYLVSLEKLSNHPIANAILSCYTDAKTLEVSNYEVIPAKGIKGIIKDKRVEVKSYDDKASANTNVELLVDGVSKGIISLEDEIKEEAKDLIKKLKEKGIESIMLTGDSYAPAASVANQVGIKEFYSSVSPLDKGEIVKKLGEKKKVAFVGDGINDAVAMKNAFIGFSPLHSTDVSISASDVLLLKDDLGLTYKTIEISKLVYRNIIINLILAAFYNLIAIPLACFGILNPVLSSIMMGLSNILVVSNSVLIKYKKIK